MGKYILGIFLTFVTGKHKGDMQTDKDRILELRKALEYYNYKYYVENAPEISDQQFDELMHELEKLEAAWP